jgi:antitoxin component of MazEF toxin-antitoxin module
MGRKVIKIGPASLVVSLPASWTGKYGVKKGDELEVEERGRALHISTKKALAKEEAAINISKYAPMIMRTLGVLYKIGYKKIKVVYGQLKPGSEGIYRGKGLHELELIRRAASSYTGMDIERSGIKPQKNEILLIERANVMYSEFDNTLNQAFLHLTQLSEQVTEALSKSNGDEKEIDLTDNLINQTTNFCQKILNTQGYQEFSKTHFVYHIVVGIEDLGDRYRTLHEDYSKKKMKKAGPELIALLKKLDSMLDEYYALFRKFDVQRMTALGFKYHSLCFDLEAAAAKIRREEFFILAYLMDIANRIYDLLEPLMALNNEKLVEDGPIRHLA